MPKMRAKMRVVHTKTHPGRGPDGAWEELELAAVSKSGRYPADGSDEDNTFAKWTPTASLKMSITNPELVGQFQCGETYHLDFTKAD
jgi:hypothetical protein